MQEPKNPVDNFVGTWGDRFPKLLENSNLIEISVATADSAEKCTHVAVLDGRVYHLGPDTAWNHLKCDRLCLHAKNGRIFGLVDRDGIGSFLPFTARKEDRQKPTGKTLAGDGADIFDEMVDRSFYVRSISTWIVGPPVAKGTEVQIRREGDEYRLVACVDGHERTCIDHLRPDHDNATLSSESPSLQGMVRSLTLWKNGEGEGAVRRLFSMVAIPAEAGSGGPGDPLIVWGADDGGGNPPEQ